jgi:hypothetical protein
MGSNRMHSTLGILTLSLCCTAGSVAAHVPKETRTEFDEVPPNPDADENPFWFPNMPRAGFGIYAGGGGVALKPSVLAREGMGQPTGIALGFSGFGWRYLFADLGLGWLWATDRAPFEETACELSTGMCGTTESSIDGFMGWAKVGPQLRFFLPVGDSALELALLCGVGVRGFSLSREAKHGGVCDDCRSEHVAAGGGLLVSPEADLAYAFGSHSDSGALGVKIAYERYLWSDADYGLWVSGFFEAYTW